MTNDDLLAQSERQAGEVSAIVERGEQALEATYKRLGAQDGESRFAALRDALLSAVEQSRSIANALAAVHVGDQLRALIGDKADSVSFGLNSRPRTSEVDEYVNNAVQAARDAIEADQPLESTSWWGERLIESETFREYDESRRVAESSLSTMSDAETTRLGFRVARKESDLRGDVGAQTRGDVPLIPMVGKSWNAVSDKRTCQICSGLHGKLGLLGRDFDPDNPPVHSRCRCVSTLWAVAWIDTEKTMADITTRDAEPLLRAYATIDTRAAKDDERTIYGAVASTEARDSHGSIIRAKGWNLSRYESNPVLLWNHAASGFMSKASPEDVLGTASMKVDKRGKRLLADLNFAPAGENPRADLVWGQVQRGEVRGLSVGFRPTEYHYENEGGNDELLVIDAAELVELSVVPLPSNPDTLIAQMRCLYDSCEAHTASRETSPGKVDEAMSDTKKVTLPAEIASILGTSDVDEGVRLITEGKLRVDQLEAEMKRKDEDHAAVIATLTADLATATSDATEARAALDAYHAASADAEVDALIKLGCISEKNRETACKFARSDLESFRKFYDEARDEAAKRNAPMQHLLDTTPVVEPKIDKPAKPIGSFVKEHRALAKRLQADTKCSWADACTMAFKQLNKTQATA